jgi:hypothetical protein
MKKHMVLTSSRRLTRFPKELVQTNGLSNVGDSCGILSAPTWDFFESLPSLFCSAAFEDTATFPPQARSDPAVDCHSMLLSAFLWCVLEGLDMLALTLPADPVREDLMAQARYPSCRAETLLEWFNGSGNKCSRSKTSPSSSGRLSGGCVSRRIFQEVGRPGGRSGLVMYGKPWLYCRRDPGSSMGKSGVEGSDAERGLVESDLCMEADLGSTLDVGERSISLKIAIRLDAELTRRTLYGDNRGLDADCSWSGGIMERLEGRLRDFWVSLQLVSEYTITTSNHAAARCTPAPIVTTPLLCATTSTRIAHCQLTTRQPAVNRTFAT